MSLRQTSIESSLDTKERAKKKRISPYIALALAAGALTGCAANAQAESPAPSVSSTEAPAPSASPIEIAPVVAPIEVEPLSAELSPQELVEGTMEMFDEWAVSGAKPDQIKATMADNTASNLGIAYFDMRTAETAAVYAEAIYGPNWENDSHIAEAVATLTETNRIILKDAFDKEVEADEQRQLMNDESIESEPPITLKTTITNVAEAEPEMDGTVVVTFNRLTEFENDPSKKSETLQAAYHYSVENEDGNAYIVGYNVNDFETHY